MMVSSFLRTIICIECYIPLLLPRYDESKPKSLSLTSSWMNNVCRDGRLELRFELRWDVIDPPRYALLRPVFAGESSKEKSSDDGSFPVAFLLFCSLGPLSVGAKKNSMSIHISLRNTLRCRTFPFIIDQLNHFPPQTNTNTLLSLPKLLKILSPIPCRIPPRRSIFSHIRSSNREI
jgi:hypothetical protein